MKRRSFLKILATAAASAKPLLSFAAESDDLGKILPTRSLGPKGPSVTCISLGGFHIGWTTDALAQATIEAALEEGVRFFDTAESYGNGLSEKRYGKWLIPKYRDRIFLMSKSTAEDAVTARSHLEGSLRRLGTDRLDLWQIHSLTSPEDTDARLDAGVLEVALQAQQEGKIAHLGFTGHVSPYALTRMIERTSTDGSTPFLTCQYPVNPVDAASKHSFIANVLPAATELGIATLAMKTLADGRFFATKAMEGKTVWETSTPVIPNGLSIEDCINFALSLPIGSLITGAEKPEFVREKALMARNQRNLTETARQNLIHHCLAFANSGEVEYYKSEALRS